MRPERRFQGRNGGAAPFAAPKLNPTETTPALAYCGQKMVLTMGSTIVIDVSIWSDPAAFGFVYGGLLYRLWHVGKFCIALCASNGGFVQLKSHVRQRLPVVVSKAKNSRGTPYTTALIPLPESFPTGTSGADSDTGFHPLSRYQVVQIPFFTPGRELVYVTGERR